jgi:hypothetical protein
VVTAVAAVAYCLPARVLDLEAIVTKAAVVVVPEALLLTPMSRPPEKMAAVSWAIQAAAALQVERLRLLEPLVQHKLALAGRVAAVAGLGPLLRALATVAMALLVVVAEAAVEEPEMGLPLALAVTAVAVMSLCIRTEV